MLNKYEFKETMKAYEDISHKKKMFITPYVLSDKEYAVTWQQEQNELKEQIDIFMTSLSISSCTFLS